MSKDLWDMAERATKYIKDNVKDDINEDMVTGELYLEFYEPTKAKLEILGELQIGERVVVKNMNDYSNKYLNGKEGYIYDVDIDINYPIIVNLQIDGDIFAKYCFKRENLRSV